MPVVALRCPHCGGDIELDDKKEFGFCCHCGTKIMIQEQIKQRYCIDNSDKIDNWLELSKSAMFSKNYSEAKRYADTAIAEDTSSKKAWFMKMCCVLSTEDLLDEAIFCSGKCRGIDGEYFLDSLDLLFDSICLRFDYDGLAKRMEAEGENPWFVDDFEKYLEKVNEIFTNLYSESINEENIDLFLGRVTDLLESVPGMKNAITKIIVVWTCFHLFELLGEIEKRIYVPYTQDKHLIRLLNQSFMNISTIPDKIMKWSIRRQMSAIADVLGLMADAFDQAYLGYSEEEDRRAWEFLREHPDIADSLEKEIDEATDALILAQSKIFGREKKVREAKYRLIDCIRKSNYPEKLFFTDIKSN